MKVIKRYNNLSITIKASLWFTITKFLQKGIALITTPIFTRLLNEHEYGIVSIYYSWYDIILIFTSLKLAYGVYNNGLLEFENDENQFTSALQGLSTTTTFLFFLVYLFNKDFIINFTGLNNQLIILLFLQLLTINGMDLWSARNRFHYHYKLLVFIMMSISILAPVIAVIFIPYAESKVFTRIVSFASIQISIYGLIYIYNFIKGGVFYNKNYWKYALRFNLPLLPHFLAQIVLNNSDRIMISNLVGLDKAGIYSVAYSASMLLNLFVISINSTLLPWTYRKIQNKNFKVIKDTTSKLLYFIFLINIIFILLAPEIVYVFAPPSYQEAILIIGPISASTYFILVYTLIINVEMYYKDTNLITKASIIASILNVILNWFLIPMFGYVVAGYTTLICYVVLVIAHYIAVTKISVHKNESSKIYNYKIMLYIGVLIIIVAISSSFLYQLNLIRYFILFAIITLMIFSANKFIKNIRTFKNSL